MFTPNEFILLCSIQNRAAHGLKYISDLDKWHLTDYWEPDKLLLPMAELQVDCEDYARACMLRSMAYGFTARLIVCTDETGAGHCICEVTDDEKDEAYYFDCRQEDLAVRSDLKKYSFYSASPWNPQPGEKRPWVRIST
jgi:predicted transglutaminase-like cysteine proteinase